MSEFDDYVAAQTETNRQISEHLDGLSADIDTLNKQIQELVVAQGTLTPAQQSALNTLTATGQELATRAGALDALTNPPAPVDDPTAGTVAG